MNLASKRSAGQSVSSGRQLPAPSPRPRSPAAAAPLDSAAQKGAASTRNRGGSSSSSVTARLGGAHRPTAARPAAPRRRAAAPQSGATDINERDSFEQTPLIRAAPEGDTAVLRQLLGQGANVNAWDKWGTTPLMLAAGKGHAAAVKLLLQHGADVERRDCYGRTALTAVSLWGAFSMFDNVSILSFSTPYSARGAHEAAQALVAAGADVNAQDDMGFTPLARLAQASIDEHAAATARLLLASGADGAPALEAALHFENLAALEVLISAGMDASALLAERLEFTLKRGLAADEALLLLRAGASMEQLPHQLKRFAFDLAMRDRAERLQGSKSDL